MQQQQIQRHFLGCLWGRTCLGGGFRYLLVVFCAGARARGGVRGGGWLVFIENIGGVLFLFLGLLVLVKAPTRDSPERVRGTNRTFPEQKSGTPPPPRLGNPPVELLPTIPPCSLNDDDDDDEFWADWGRFPSTYHRHRKEYLPKIFFQEWIWAILGSNYLPTLVIKMITCNYFCFREFIFWWL